MCDSLHISLCEYSNGGRGSQHDRKVLQQSMAFEHIAEQKIREAIEQGEFSNLPGAGKPLAVLDDHHVGDDWAGLHMLRENGFLPEWLELRKQIYYDRAGVISAFDAWERAFNEWGFREHIVVKQLGETYLRKVGEINAKIDLHNLRCPSFRFEIARFRDDFKPPRR
jgi:hypothetical protein